MTQHGFARDRRFEWVERTAMGCRLALCDDAETWVHYPFAFRLELAYAIVDGGLDVTFSVVNTGDDILPASIGAHPAFRWPLAEGAAKQAHTLTFENDEPGKLRGVAGGLLTAANHPSPIRGRELALSPDLFAADALILDHPASRWVRFSVPGGPALTVRWDGFEQLGIWSRVDAEFLCIEPWRGMSSPVDFDGEFMDKPWLMLIEPGARAEASMRIEISP
jgi:galactose mutarotase-like enzyme